MPEFLAKPLVQAESGGGGNRTRERFPDDSLCESGCGHPAPIAHRSDPAKGHVRGRSVRFISGHNGASSPFHYGPEDHGYGTPCWIWKRATDSHGYGQIRVRGKLLKAHRFSYELSRGQIQAGLQLDHLCRVRACVNPDHLEPVTAVTNVRRCSAHLTDAEVEAIRGRADQLLTEAHAQGKRQRRAGWIGALAAEYGVSRQTIKRAAGTA